MGWVEFTNEREWMIATEIIPHAVAFHNNAVLSVAPIVWFATVPVSIRILGAVHPFPIIFISIRMVVGRISKTDQILIPILPEKSVEFSLFLRTGD